MALFSGLLKNLAGKPEKPNCETSPEQAPQPTEPPLRAPVPVMSDALRHTISRLKEEAPMADRTPPDRLAPLLPVACNYERELAAEEEARRLATAEAMKTPQPGQLIPGKGVYVGVWETKASSLAERFNIYAAPHDLGLGEQGQGRKRVAA